MDGYHILTGDAYTTGKLKETKYHGILRRGTGRPQGFMGLLSRPGEYARTRNDSVDKKPE